MSHKLHSIELASEQDVVSARQRARSIAEALGFDHHDQIRITTATSEIARNAFRYARGGNVSYEADPEKGIFRIIVTDKGGGIPHLDRVMSGSYRSPTGMGMGILGTKRLMDEFSIDSSSSGTRVGFGKQLPAQSRSIDSEVLQSISTMLARRYPATPLDELQIQNRELMKTLDELRERKEELARINAELQDTNRGVVALYAELDERADYLRRASELKSSFLSNMSHEFRTPLNSMLALTRMLLDRMDGDLTPEQDQQLRFIQQSAKELAEMVNDLLDLAKVEAGRLEVKPSTFEVAGLFGALRGMLKPLLADNSLNLVFEHADHLPPLFTDEQKISQILRNFISNAIKFTPRGEVRVRARLHDDGIEFSVTDTGIGISESDQHIIFEEFAQVDSNLQKRVKGTGLGLPLSRNLAHLLGGSVEVESTVGIGSSFRLIVPIVFPGAARTEELTLPEIRPEQKLVLIVEDNPETAFVYSRYLNNAGFQTYAVAALEDAKAVLARITPAAIILDVLLRSDTSWNFLRELKANSRSVPVLVMSVVNDEHRVYGLGADAFLTKPFVPEQMIGEIVRLTSASARLRILMVDDNEVSRYLLRENIAEGQYQMFEARDGREGLRLANEIKPSLIFLDYYMPDLNGAQVLRDLRNTPELARIPVVVHSTKTFDEAELRFFREQFVSIFPKQALTLPDSAIRLRELMHALTAHAEAEKSRDA
ncbi:ATP-binding protein [Terracidiphilus sp.]|jgi:signal transduction histidine kinase/CheY-like chemotaxis protein|uniref:ATP-binding protein n=1 Tax=Terracidiphilus sp. TaxID=1964191 RepID=UPI003C2A2548